MVAVSDAASQSPKQKESPNLTQNENSLKQALAKGIVSQIFKKRKTSQKVLEDAEKPL